MHALCVCVYVCVLGRHLPIDRNLRLINLKRNSFFLLALDTQSICTKQKWATFSKIDGSRLPFKQNRRDVRYRSRLCIELKYGGPQFETGSCSDGVLIVSMSAEVKMTLQNSHYL